MTTSGGCDKDGEMSSASMGIRSGCLGEFLGQLGCGVPRASKRSQEGAYLGVLSRQSPLLHIPATMMLWFTIGPKSMEPKKINGTP